MRNSHLDKAFWKFGVEFLACAHLGRSVKSVDDDGDKELREQQEEDDVRLCTQCKDEPQPMQIEASDGSRGRVQKCHTHEIVEKNVCKRLCRELKAFRVDALSIHSECCSTCTGYA